MNAPSSMDDTICAPATPPGSSAIAVVRLSGRDAIGIGSRVFSPDVLRGADSHTLHHGYILRGEEVVDEVLVSVFRAPHTYTGEDLLEISCHGSAFIMEEILNLLVQAGARPAEPGEFTRRAFVNGKLDLSQAEAVADLVESHSEGARRAAVQHLKGGISKIIEKLRSQLAEFSALLELELDFGEEDVEFADRSALKKLIYEIIGVVEKMVASFDAGNAIKNGIPVVISGRPNAGKSTLLNAILNENMALVSEEPGTTRDSIEADIHFDGLLYRFIDTAGMRKAGNNIEHLGIERTKEKIRASSIIIYLFDVNTVSEEMALEDIEEIKHISDEQNPHIIPTGNKTDIAPAGVSSQFSSLENTVFISALNSNDAGKLLKTVASVGKDICSPEGEVILSNSRHLSAFSEVQAALNAAMKGIEEGRSEEFIATDVNRAIHHLGSITGEVTNDEILDLIFSRFCIGK